MTTNEKEGLRIEISSNGVLVKKEPIGRNPVGKILCKEGPGTGSSFYIVLYYIPDEGLYIGECSKEIELRKKKEEERQQTFSFPTQKKKERLPLNIGNDFESVRINPEEQELKSKMLSVKSASRDALAILTMWNTLRTPFARSHARLHSMESNSVKKSLYLIDHMLLKKYTKDQIINAITDFRFMAQEPDAYDLPKKPFSLYSFLKGDEYTRTESLFKKIMVFGLKKISKHYMYTPDEEVLAARIERYYMKRVLGEEVVFTRKQKQDFLKASAALIKYMKKGRLNKYVEGADWKDYMRILFKALAANKGLRFKTWDLCSDYTYNDLIPKYLSENFEVTTR